MSVTICNFMESRKEITVNGVWPIKARVISCLFYKDPWKMIRSFHAVMNMNQFKNDLHTRKQ